MYDNKDVKYSRLVIENIDVLIDWLIDWLITIFSLVGYWNLSFTETW